MNISIVKRLTISLNKGGVFGSQAVKTAAEQAREIEKEIDRRTLELCDTADLKTIVEFVEALNEGHSASHAASVMWALEQLDEIKKLEYESIK